MATSSLASIATKAQQLADQIAAKGVNVAEPKEIVATAKSLLGVLDELQPHINTAQAAIGGQEQTINDANNLRNKLNRVVSAYGGA